MRVHRSAQLIRSRLELHRHTSLSDQLGRVWSNDVHAQNLVVLLLADDLHKALFLTDDAGLARSGERKLSDLNVVTHLLRLRLSEPDRSDFRIAVSTVGNEAQVDRTHVLLAGYVFDCNDAFFRSEVGQQRRGHYVADCINALLRSLLILINLDESSFDFDLRAFESESFRVRHAPNSNQQHLRFETHR